MLVTGAAGGVGSVAVALLARLGHEVAAVTGRPETEDYLRGLGAARIVPRGELAEPIARGRSSRRPGRAASTRSAAPMLARVMKQLKYRCAVAAVGNAGGVDVPLSIIPFLLRGVSLLGIDSVLQPFESAAAGLGAAGARPRPRQARGDDRGRRRSPSCRRSARAILKGEVQGRVVVDVRA